MQNVLNKYFVFRYSAANFALKEDHYYLIVSNQLERNYRQKGQDAAGVNSFASASFFQQPQRYLAVRLNQKTKSTFNLHVDPNLAAHAGTNLNQIPLYRGGRGREINLMVYDKGAQATYFLEQKQTLLFLGAIRRYCLQYDQRVRTLGYDARKLVRLYQKSQKCPAFKAKSKVIKQEARGYLHNLQTSKKRLQELSKRQRTSWNEAAPFLSSKPALGKMLGFAEQIKQYLASEFTSAPPTLGICLRILHLNFSCKGFCAPNITVGSSYDLHFDYEKVPNLPSINWLIPYKDRQSLPTFNGDLARYYWGNEVYALFDVSKYSFAPYLSNTINAEGALLFPEQAYASLGQYLGVTTSSKALKDIEKSKDLEHPYTAAMVLSGDILEALANLGQEELAPFANLLARLGQQIYAQATSEKKSSKLPSPEQLKAKAQDLIADFITCIDEQIKTCYGRKKGKDKQLSFAELTRDLGQDYVSPFAPAPELGAYEYLEALAHEREEKPTLLDFNSWLKLPASAKEQSFAQAVLPAHAPRLVVQKFNKRLDDVILQLESLFALKLEASRYKLEEFASLPGQYSQTHNNLSLLGKNSEDLAPGIQEHLEHILSAAQGNSFLSYKDASENQPFARYFAYLQSDDPHAFAHLRYLEQELSLNNAQLEFYNRYLTLQFALGYLNLNAYFVARLRGLEVAYALSLNKEKSKTKVKAAKKVDPYALALSDGYLNDKVAPLVRALYAQFKQEGILGKTLAQALRQLSPRPQVLRQELDLGLPSPQRLDYILPRIGQEVKPVVVEAEPKAKSWIALALEGQVPEGVKVTKITDVKQIKKIEPQVQPLPEPEQDLPTFAELGERGEEIIDLNFIKRNLLTFLNLKRQQDAKVSFLQQPFADSSRVVNPIGLLSLRDVAGLKDLEIKIYVGVELLSYLPKRISTFTNPSKYPELYTVPTNSEAIFQGTEQALAPYKVQAQLPMGHLQNLAYNYAGSVIGSALLRNRLGHFADRDRLYTYQVYIPEEIDFLTLDYGMREIASVQLTQASKAYAMGAKTCSQVLKRLQQKYPGKQAFKSFPSYGEALGQALSHFAQEREIKKGNEQFSLEQGRHILQNFGNLLYYQVEQLVQPYALPNHHATTIHYLGLLEKINKLYNSWYSKQKVEYYFTGEQSGAKGQIAPPLPVNGEREQKAIYEQYQHYEKIVTHIKTAYGKAKSTRKYLRHFYAGIAGQYTALAHKLHALGYPVPGKEKAKSPEAAAHELAIAKIRARLRNQPHIEVPLEPPTHILDKAARLKQKQISQKVLEEILKINTKAEQYVNLHNLPLIKHVPEFAPVREFVEEISQQTINELKDNCRRALRDLYRKVLLCNLEKRQMVAAQRPELYAVRIHALEDKIWDLELDWCRLIARFVCMGASQKELRPEFFNYALHAGMRPYLVAQVEKTVRDYMGTRKFITAIEILEKSFIPHKSAYRRNKALREALSRSLREYQSFKRDGANVPSREQVLSQYDEPVKPRATPRERKYRSYRDRIEDFFYEQTYERVFNRNYHDTKDAFDDFNLENVMAQVLEGLSEIEISLDDFLDLPLERIKALLLEPRIYNRIVSRWFDFDTPLLKEILANTLMRHLFKFCRTYHQHGCKVHVADPLLYAHNWLRVFYNLLDELYYSQEIMLNDAKMRMFTPWQRLQVHHQVLDKLIGFIHEAVDEVEQEFKQFNRVNIIVKEQLAQAKEEAYAFLSKKYDKEQASLVKAKKKLKQLETKALEGLDEHMQDLALNQANYTLKHLTKVRKFTLDPVPRLEYELVKRYRQSLQDATLDNMQFYNLHQYIVAEKVEQIKEQIANYRKFMQVAYNISDAELEAKQAQLSQVEIAPYLKEHYKLQHLLLLINPISEQELAQVRPLDFASFNALLLGRMQQEQPQAPNQGIWQLAPEQERDDAIATVYRQILTQLEDNPFADYEQGQELLKQILAGKTEFSLENWLQMCKLNLSLGRSHAGFTHALLAWLIASLTKLNYGLVYASVAHPEFLTFYREFSVDYTYLQRQYQHLAQGGKGHQRIAPPQLEYPVAALRELDTFDARRFVSMPDEFKSNAFVLFALKASNKYQLKQKAFAKQIPAVFAERFKLKPEQYPALYADFAQYLQEQFWQGQAYTALVHWVSLKDKLGYKDFNLAFGSLYRFKDKVNNLYTSPYYWNSIDLTQIIVPVNRRQGNYADLVAYFNWQKSVFEDQGARIQRYLSHRRKFERNSTPSATAQEVWEKWQEEFAKPKPKDKTDKEQ
ncbi:hypothetical protein CJP74_00285 [Psittacicella melopsittaci]|uniref:Uncharacterized protein n=1 Tax=Psittacicella melopsittaci TaxID=2028576 RepID=A0A3A1Y730_9GAMM|nr:hypothetical protein [Psittacicella melopsittaci]RIY34052.1 hypothetical protein CJP74_00285 [Psittacicella melopsittaci]